jgi:hypothetical protein
MAEEVVEEKQQVEISKAMDKGELTPALNSALAQYRKSKRGEDLQRLFAILGGAFRTLRTKDAAQGIAVMQGLAPKMVGMSAAEKAELVQPLIKQLSQEEQKRATEYSKLVGKAIDTEKEALKTYLAQLGRFASAQGTTEAAKVRAQTAALKEELDQLEGPDEKITSDTKAMVSSIKSAAAANTDNPEDFERHVSKDVAVALNDEGIDDSQKKALLRSLRPSMPDGYADAALKQKFDEDPQKDDEETAQKRRELVETFKTNIRMQYGPSVGRFTKDADARLAKASENTNKAVQEFRQKNPMGKILGPSAAAESAKASIQQIQETPDKAFRSQILRGRIEQMDAAKPFLQEGKGFKDLLSFYKKEQKAKRRGEVFKLPAPPTAVYGAESQVAVDEEPDGTNPTAA